MIYDIRHRIEYLYSDPVYLEPHRVRMTPRSDAFQRVRSFVLDVDPQPSCQTEITDALGNPAHELWFRGTSDRLVLEAVSRVETLNQNPFNFLVHENCLRLPLCYSQPVGSFLEVYRGMHGEEDSRIVEFAAIIASRSGFETVGFLSELCLELKRHIRCERREEGFPKPPSQTLLEGHGACRDLAMLFIACCRSQGLAARFTSGYCFDRPDVVRRDLHAWAEVYLEGAGWRGFDPGTGLVVCDHHVAVASAPAPEFVTPVHGTFRAMGASSRMQASVNMTLFAPMSALT